MKAQRKKILVADCHEDGLIVLEKLLEDAGFETTTVWAAKDALSLVESHVFDLVLLSKLPGAECEELLKQLHEKHESVTCIVMLSNLPEMMDFTALEGLGARDVVCKHAYGQILEMVRECLACDQKQLSASSLDDGSVDRAA